MTTTNTTVSSVLSGDTAAEITGSETYGFLEVTTMNTTTNETTVETVAVEVASKPAKAPKAPKAPKVKKLYPFLTKAQIKASIESDFGFACMVVSELYNRQTTFEQETKSTLNRNRRGFMSSHAVNGSVLAVKIRNGEELTAEDVAMVQEIAPRYTTQMALHFRDQAIEKDPTLAEKSACYFSAQ